MSPPARTRELHTVDPAALAGTASATTRWRITIRGRGPFAGSRRRSAIGCIVVARAAIGSPATFHFAAGERAIFAFPTDPDAPPPVTQGQPFPPEALVRYRPWAETHSQWPAGQPWWNLTIPLPEFERAARAMLGAPLPPPPLSAIRFHHFAPGEKQRPSHAMSEATDAADEAPDAVLEDGLLRAIIRTLAGAEPPVRHPLTPGRRLDLADALVAVADAADGPVPLLEVCRDLGVPLRTLNTASNAILGFGAAAYLRRRLTRARTDLLRGTGTGVTEIAMRHGFWELGRFAGDDRRVFGEAPSATFRRNA